MTRRTSTLAIVAIGLMCCCEIGNPAATGYFYEHPIRPFNPPTFPTLRSTGPFDGIAFGQKQGQYRFDQEQGQYRSQAEQQGQYRPQGESGQYRPRVGSQTRPAAQQQLQFQTTPRPQRPPPVPQLSPLPQQQPLFSRSPVTTPYTYNKPQKQFPTTVQPRINPQTTKFAFRPAPPPTPRPTAKPLPRLPAPTSAPPKAGPLSSPDVYVINGRQLKQYKVYEQIDNDIEQDAENFIPANFFLNSYHARISPTHALSENFQVDTRASFPRSQRLRQQGSPNAIAIGSGGLGFVKLPNGNVYLGSGSLGYISSLQRIQDVEEARTRTGASSPDALHFGHGPLSDSFYYQSKK